MWRFFRAYIGKHTGWSMSEIDGLYWDEMIEEFKLARLFVTGEF